MRNLTSELSAAREKRASIDSEMDALSAELGRWKEQCRSSADRLVALEQEKSLLELRVASLDKEKKTLDREKIHLKVSVRR